MNVHLNKFEFEVNFSEVRDDEISTIYLELDIFFLVFYQELSTSPNGKFF